MPAGRLAFIRLAEGGRRYEASPLNEAVFPKFCLHFVIARIGHALRRIAIAQQDEPPAPQCQLTFTIDALLDDRRHATRKDRRQRAEYRHAVVGNVELSGEISAACLDAV